MTPEYYSQRLLNPFRGCIQVIRHQAAEAVSMDGVHWDIYVSNDSLLEGLAGDAGAVQVSDIRYGSWSLEKGLKRGALYPSGDFYAMERMGAVVFEQLMHLHERIPFPYRDHFECWLLDRLGRPLALLDSALTAAEVERQTHGHPASRWQVGQAALTSFDSPAAPPGQAGLHLMQYINALADGAPGTTAGRTVWYRREADGGGTPMPVGEPQPSLPASAFPPLLLAETGHTGHYARLVADFLAWQAPWLLLLPDLDRASRRALERHARSQAQEVERQHRLYPALVDPDQIGAARVEARLLQAQEARTQGPEADLATFYIELNPSGVD